MLLDLGQLLTGQWSGVAISKLAMEYWPLSVALKALFYVRFIALPVWLSAQPLVTVGHVFWSALVRNTMLLLHCVELRVHCHCTDYWHCLDTLNGST